MTTNTTDPMQRLAEGLCDMLEGMIAARQELGMTNPDEIAQSILDSIRNLIND